MAGVMDVRLADRISCELITRSREKVCVHHGRAHVMNPHFP